MTADGENAGLHRQWLERKLEIEVGKVQAKLRSKGMSVPMPDPGALEEEARLAQTHLPKLYIELYGRNPNGTLKLSSDAHRRGSPPPHATLVQKLDRVLNPALLTPIPVEVALAHGLPLSCCGLGGGGDGIGGLGVVPEAEYSFASSGGARELAPRGAAGRAAASHGKQQQHQPPLQQHYQQHQQHQQIGGSVAGGVAESGGGGGGGGGSSPRTSRSSPPLAAGPSQPPVAAVHCRPDLQAVDLRIDDAVAEVHRVALHASAMTPRDRVLFLAREANPHFCLLPHTRSVQLAVMAGGAAGLSRRELLRRSGSRRVTSFTPDPTAAWGLAQGSGRGAGSRTQRPQPSASRRSLGAVELDSRRSRDASCTSLPSAGCSVASAPPGGGVGVAADGPLPFLASSSSRSRYVSRNSSGHDAAAAAAVEGQEAVESLPRLSPCVSPVPSTAPGSGEAEVEEAEALPKLPLLQPGGATSVGPEFPCTAQAGLWSAAALMHAAEVAAARAAEEAEALAAAEAAAEAEAEAAAAVAEAEAEAAAGAARVPAVCAHDAREARSPRPALEAEVEAEARAAAGLLEKAPAISDGGGSGSVRLSGRGDGGGGVSPTNQHTVPHQGPGWIY